MKPALVWITRPQEQAGALCARLQQAGLRCECLPTLATQSLPTASAPTPAAQWNRLIFVSRAAVQYGWPVLQAADPDFARCALAAVGPGSAKALQELGGDCVLAPAQGGAQALLNMDQMQTVSEQHILILAAPGGRQVLQHTLAQRGARVQVFQCYQRVAPDDGALRIGSLIHSKNPLIVTQTSASGLRFMLEMVPKPLRGPLLQLPLVVISPRLAVLATQMGFRHIHSSRDSTLDGFADAICQAAGCEDN